MRTKYNRPVAMAGIALGFLLSVLALFWDYLTRRHVVHFSEDQLVVLLSGIFIMAASFALVQPNPARCLKAVIVTIGLLAVLAEGALYLGWLSFPYHTGSLASIESPNVLSPSSMEYLRQNYRSGDKIIYMDSTMVYQLRPFHIDYHLRQMRTEGGRIPFQTVFDDPYTGVPILDSVERLTEVLHANPRCWIIVDQWVAKTSPDLEEFLESQAPAFVDPLHPHVKLVLVEVP